MSSSLSHLRTLNPQTPKDWRRPREWRPPEHVPADSSKTYRYRSRHPLIVIGAAVLVLVAAGVARLAAMQGPGSALANDGECPSNFNAVGGARHECHCGPGPFSGSVWGTGTYTADSSLCRAALHAGAIGPTGGSVTAVAASGCPSYAGTSANGVDSSSWGAYLRSFHFEGFGNGSCASTPQNPRSPCPSTFAAAGGPAELHCTCPASASHGPVWGRGVYTTDSSLCAAARHAGAIGPEGGEVRARPAAGCSAYASSTRNGITTHAWGQYGSSFYIVGHGTSTCSR